METSPNAHTVPISKMQRIRRIGLWSRRMWIVPVATIAVAFVVFSVAPYLTFDPSQSRIPPPPDVQAYYPLLVAHVLFGSVAMLSGCLQMWPWLRRRNPTAHRVVGRIYVACGVVPAGILAIAIGSVGPFGYVLRVSDILLGAVWLAVTAQGYRFARAGRLVEHRRWMIRSFALTMSVITNRVWAVIGFVVLYPQLATTFGGNETMLIQTIAGLSGWLGWVLTLLVVEAYLEIVRPVRRPTAHA